MGETSKSGTMPVYSMDNSNRTLALPERSGDCLNNGSEVGCDQSDTNWLLKPILTENYQPPSGPHSFQPEGMDEPGTAL